MGLSRSRASNSDAGNSSGGLVGSSGASLDRGSSGGSRSTGSRGGSGAGAAGAGGAAGRAASVESRAGDGVGGQGLVDVDLNTRVGVLVESSTEGTLGLVATTAGNLEVETLGVVLSTILVTSGVKGNDFVTHDIVAGSNAAGDGHGPAVVAGDQIVGGPGVVTAADEALLIDLEELELGLVDGGAVAVAVGEVGDDRTLVTLGPGSPLQLDLLASSDLSRDSAVFGVLVADNVGIGI